MDLTYRPLQPRDFDACLGLFRGRAAYLPATVDQLPTFWKSLLAQRALLSAVIESRESSGQPRIVALGTSAFVTDAYMCEARSGNEPYLTARTIALELAGRSPVLQPARIRRANSGEGLNLLILQYGEAREHLSPDERIAVRYKMRESFVTDHRGYQLREILQEYWDEIELPFVLSGWGRLRTDYGDYFRGRRIPLPPPDRRPYLIGFTRAEARAEPGSMVAPLFVYSAPRFFFSPAEQELLASALSGETDAQLASSLHLALPTVKGRWRQIYARVATVSPELLPELCEASPEQARGREKRRPLLDYLRRHPEELRPHVRPRATQAQR
jgi:DNA-binding CsgD family transcriptional regulator